MSERHIRVASIRAVESLAEVNCASVVRAHLFASVTFGGVTYYAEGVAR